MVKVRDTQPIDEQGHVDVALWCERLHESVGEIPLARIQLAIATVQECMRESQGRKWGHGSNILLMGLEIADVMAELQADEPSLVAAILYRAVREEKYSLSKVVEVFGQDVASLVEGVLRMAAISATTNPTRQAVLGQPVNQLDNMRKMLVTMIDDVRIALIKLAERTAILRAVKDASDERRRKVAREVFDVYAPLAHRLGVGHLKWELEDLSFRYLQPGAYKKIAKLLDEKRVDRDSYIEEVIDEINRQLEKAGIDAQIMGRAKHIYSIWRKMQKKQIDFYEVYDVRAVRILVPTLQDCYTTLGIVHSLWQHVQNEFDDYIASPKTNGYQSLHTAVVGPERKMLEIQIRTEQMHEDAELGVAAHWRYKEGAAQSERDSNSGYEDKIAWLRQVLEWHDDLGGDGVNAMLQGVGEVSSGRVYVFTPEGHVLDLANGATPVDFAYSVHTEVGHRCRGAKVNGRIVPLNYELKNGERIEILTVKEGGPSRDWLNPSLGYVNTSNARAKIQHWFKLQDRDENIDAGRDIIEREMRRLAMRDIDWSAVLQKLPYKEKEDIYAAIGAGVLRPAQVVNIVQTLVRDVERAESQQQELLPLSHSKAATNADDIMVQGVGQLMSSIASCCQPVPGDPILGYITQGRGVSVHHQDCTNLRQLQKEDPQRVIEVSWGFSSEIAYPVDVFIKAYDRQGLLRDIMLVLAQEHVNVTAAHSESSNADSTATMLLTIEVASIGSLGKVLAKLDQLPNIIEVQRYKK